MHSRFSSISGLYPLDGTLHPIRQPKNAPDAATRPPRRKQSLLRTTGLGKNLAPPLTRRMTLDNQLKLSVPQGSHL